MASNVLLRPRVVFAGILVACVAMVLTAIFYFQEDLGLDPCPMCILSRYTFIAIGAVALVGALHGPRGAAPGASTAPRRRRADSPRPRRA